MAVCHSLEKTVAFGDRGKDSIHQGSAALAYFEIKIKEHVPH